MNRKIHRGTYRVFKGRVYKGWAGPKFGGGFILVLSLLEALSSNLASGSLRNSLSTSVFVIGKMGGAQMPNKIKLGSGFRIRSSADSQKIWILTAYHTLDFGEHCEVGRPCHSLNAVHQYVWGQSQWVPEFSPPDSQRAQDVLIAWRPELLFFDSKIDAALIEIRGLDSKRNARYHPMDIDQCASQRGAPVTLMGYSGIHNLWILNYGVTVDMNTIEFENATHQGASGAPVVNSLGNLVGMFIGYYRKYPKYGAILNCQSLNHFVNRALRVWGDPSRNEAAQHP